MDFPFYVLYLNLKFYHTLGKGSTIKTTKIPGEFPQLSDIVMKKTNKKQIESRRIFYLSQESFQKST